MAKKILLVDDEPHLLDGIRRQLRNKFDLETAIGAAEGLKRINGGVPFAVVVSDMQMPDMSGVEFLKEVKLVTPATVRIMLTGNSDQDTATNAVNEGNIFRFLTKPCATEQLVKALNDALVQYELIMAERELLQATLTGSIRIFTEIVSLTNPVLFSEGVKAREIVKRFGEKLGLHSTWELELASMLANIGFVAVPESVLKKRREGHPLDDDELQLITKAPATGSKLLANIPRLDEVAKIVLYSQKNFSGSGFPHDAIKGTDIPLGARIVRIVSDFVTRSDNGVPIAKVFRDMIRNSGDYDIDLLRTFIALYTPQTEGENAEKEGFEIKPSELCPGQRILSDIITTQGTLLLCAGNILSEGSVQRLQNYAKLVGLKTAIRVDARIPSEHAEQREGNVQ